jgi:hypothetical protein
MVTFTSVGYADVVLTRDWRMPKIKGIKGSGKIKKSENQRTKSRNIRENQGVRVLEKVNQENQGENQGVRVLEKVNQGVGKSRGQSA